MILSKMIHVKKISILYYILYNMISIGINGLGRIGKSILHQAIERNKFNINAINIPDFNKETLISYLTHDSVHKTNLNTFNLTVR